MNYICRVYDTDKRLWYYAGCEDGVALRSLNFGEALVFDVERVPDVARQMCDGAFLIMEFFRADLTYLDESPF